MKAIPSFALRAHELREGRDLMEHLCNENNQDVEFITGPAGS